MVITQHNAIIQMMHYGIVHIKPNNFIKQCCPINSIKFLKESKKVILSTIIQNTVSS